MRSMVEGYWPQRWTPHDSLFGEWFPSPAELGRNLQLDQHFPGVLALEQPEEGFGHVL
jgi:hypothetical protein